MEEDEEVESIERGKGLKEDEWGWKIQGEGGGGIQLEEESRQGYQLDKQGENCGSKKRGFRCSNERRNG